MKTKLNDNQQQMVLDNYKLVHYLVRKLGIVPYSTEYEELVSIGTIGLIKAIDSFDESKKITFAYYASRCIENEIFLYFRKENKYAKLLSLDEPIGRNCEGREITLGEQIEDPESNFVEKIINEGVLVQIINIILNYLNPTERLVILYRIENKTQKEIEKMINVSRTYVSKIEKKAISKIRKAFNQQIHYKEVFSMDKVSDTYKITFSSKDISNFNKILASLMKKIKSPADLPNFKVNYNKERIVLQIHAQPNSFTFIAQIIQEIDEFSMEVLSDKNTLPVTNDSLQKKELDGKDKR